MKKIIIRILVIVFILLLVLVACFGSKDKKTAESSQPVSQQSETLENKEAEKPAESPAEPAKTKPAETKPEETKPAESKPAEPVPEETKPQETASDNTIRPELKAFLDSYEAFMDEYCEFMKNYNASDLSSLTKYMSLLEKELDFADKADKWEAEEMNDAETLYYVEVINRVNEKLLKTGLSL